MQRIPLKRTLLAGGVALALGAVTIGLALAQPSGRQQSAVSPQQSAPSPQSELRSPQSAHQAFLDALARHLGITSERLRQAMDEARAEVGPQGPGRKSGFGPRFGLGHPGRPFPLLGMNAEAAAQAIGISVQQLRQELPGHSLAEVAQAHGTSSAEVGAALTSAANQRIDQMVAAGKLTAEQANQLRQRAAQHIDEALNRVLPASRPGREPALSPSTGSGQAWSGGPLILVEGQAQRERVGELRRATGPIASATCVTWTCVT